jgi:hypothetical protein
VSFAGTNGPNAQPTYGVTTPRARARDRDRDRDRDRRPPTADRRPPTADRRPPTADPDPDLDPDLRPRPDACVLD